MLLGKLSPFGGRIAAMAIVFLFAISAASFALHVTASAQSTSTFTVGYGGTQFDTFNPFTTYTVVSTMATNDVYDYLIRYNSTFAPVVPDLAYKWTVFPNDSAAEFFLVPNATWSDGQPVTAQDVVYSYEVAANPVSRLAPNVGVVTNVTALNSHTVVIHFIPTALFLINVAAAIPIVPEHIWKQYVPNPSNSTQLSNYQDYPLVSSGPFQVTNYVQGQYIELTANPNYFYVSERPHVQHIVIQFFSDTNTMVLALQDGQIDGVAPSMVPAQVQTLKTYSNLKVVVNPGEELWYLGVNVYPYGHGNPTLKDLAVRQALAHAINTTELAQLIWQGYARPAAGLLPYGNAYYDPNLQPYSYNVTLANQILNNAGYKMGSNGVRVSPNGTALSYKLYVISEDPEEITAAEQIANSWKQIGVSAQVIPEDSSSLANTIWPNFTQDFDLWDWYQTPATPTLLDVFLANQTETGTSDSGYNNSAYDKLYGQMISTPNASQVMADAYQLQTMLYNDLPYINLYYLDSIEAFNTQAFTGYYYNMTGGPFSDVNWFTFIDLMPTSQSSSSSPSSSSTPSLSTTSQIVSTTLTNSVPPTSISTSTQSPSSSTKSSNNSALLIAVAVVVIIILVAAALLVMRRRVLLQQGRLNSI